MLRSHSRPLFRPWGHETQTSGKGIAPAPKTHSDEGYSIEANTVLFFKDALSAPASAAADMRTNSSSVGSAVMNPPPPPTPHPNLTPTHNTHHSQDLLFLAAATLFSAVLCAALVGVWAIQIYAGWYVFSAVVEQSWNGIRASLCSC